MLFNKKKLKTIIHGKAQPHGRPAVKLIETPVLLLSSCGPKYTLHMQCRFSINNILLQ